MSEGSCEPLAPDPNVKARVPQMSVIRALVLALPPRFRERHGRDLIECHLDAWGHQATGQGVARRAVFWLKAYLVTAGVVVQQWGRVVSHRTQFKRGVSMGWDGWKQDLRIALRGLRRRPSFAGVVILTLGIGLGANVAVFSVLHSVLLEPLPYEDAEQLVRIYGKRLDRPDVSQHLHLAAPVALELRDDVSSLSGVAILETSGVRGADLTGGEGPERISLLSVNAEYFDVLGWTPVLGRSFSRGEEVARRSVAVVREGIWRRHLGGQVGAIGRTLMIDGEAVQIVGVVSDAARDPIEGMVDVWVPTDLSAEVANDWDNNYLSAVARLGPGADLETLRSELTAIEARHTQMGSEAAERGFTIVALQEDLVGNSRPLLSAIMGAVLVLLLLTCVNVASLMLARAASREREIAIRSSLGSPGSRLLRTFMLEAGVLAVAGGTLGILVGMVALELIRLVAPVDLPLSEGVLLGQPVIALVGAGSVVIGLVLGMATALPFVRQRVERVLSATRSGGAGGLGRARVRAALVAVEVALAVVLLTGASALLRSVQELRSRDLGVNPQGVLTFTVGLPDMRYGSREEIYRFNEAFHASAAAIPGVQSIAATSRLPITGSYNTWGTRRAHAPGAPYEVDNIQVNQRWIAGDILETMGLDLVAGRWFDASDGSDTPYRVVINLTLAGSIFASENPLGEWVTFGGRYAEVIGIVEDEALTNRMPPAPMAYHHQRQWLSGNRQMTQVVKVDGDVVTVLPRLREALREIDSDLILFQPVPMADVVGAGMASETFAASLLSVFAALAVLLSGLGLYGVLIHHVGSQQHEIGVRMALGADTSGVVGMVVRRGIRLTLVGAGVGVMVSFLLGDTLRLLLFEVEPRDPLMLLVAPAVLLLVAGVSCYLPARRAARVDPLRALRAE